MLSDIVRKRSLVWLAVGSSTLFGMAALVGRARADGVPAPTPLTYSGVLEDAQGTPLTGSRSIAVQVWDAASAGKKLCETEPAVVTLAAGRFQSVLPDACALAVKTQPNAFVEVLVDGVPTGRAKMGAVPYAIEAARASEASGALKLKVDGLAAKDDLTAYVAKTSLPVVTAWQPYGGSLFDDAGAPIGSQTTKASYRRLGDSVEIAIATSFSASPVGDPSFVWDLPPGVILDTDKLVADEATLGAGAVVVNEIEYACRVIPRGPKGVGLRCHGNSKPASANTPAGVNKGARISLQLTAPVKGWSVNP